MKALLKILISFILVSIFFACNKADSFSNVPAIKLETFSVETASNGLEKEIKISFGFTDGDGDFGYNDDESTIEVDTLLKTCTDTGLVTQQTKLTLTQNSLFVAIKEKKNGVFVDAFISEINPICKNTTFKVLHQPLPRVEPRGSDKSLSGSIETLFLIPILENQVKRGTSKLEVYIKDRAGNKSNTITTPEFTF